MDKKTCRKCAHKVVCVAFRKIKAVLRGEEFFQQAWVARDPIFKAMADICVEYKYKRG